ncbi:hypothetical protein SJAG_05560 [Schizosaccharomyces japonicus yFS275]|uniref:Glutamyl-tRNA amidotransferase complex subunit Gta3 domain-containing protein n=1 Tax=Schizosaccharomyces japonicus (strain yFS275 / FY16936) TaxID=402676 RepID=T0S175_SCHJY|nr:hypothetical protein SJAG_05560 [Schizosaccharomyces japonicus yFS275]EQC53062.1 hypothetical protein SJAG_05560 [Schizosaccharomyces japonicus yFS275]
MLRLKPSNVSLLRLVCRKPSIAGVTEQQYQQMLDLAVFQQPSEPKAARAMMEKVNTGVNIIHTLEDVEIPADTKPLQHLTFPISVEAYEGHAVENIENEQPTKWDPFTLDSRHHSTKPFFACPK